VPQVRRHRHEPLLAEQWLELVDDGDKRNEVQSRYTSLQA
jgi:hypothetical protein